MAGGFRFVCLACKQQKQDKGIAFLVWAFSGKVLFEKIHIQARQRIISSPGRSPGRAIVLPPASALAAASALSKC